MTTPEQSTARPATPWAAGYRERLLEKLKAGQCKWDVIVVGGGITGAGILRECSRRGLQALLVEKKDFAWGTSSKSSKMVHGGLRYLATAQFGLTRDSVQERQRLMAEAPGLVDPLQFLMGHYKGQFPPGFIFNRVLDMYDLMAGKRNHRHYPARDGIYLAPGILENGLQSITQFGDAVTDDARLVLRVLHEAICEGAHALNYVGAVSVLRQSKGAGQNSPATGGSSGAVRGLLLKDEETGESFEAEASVVINATGAWADHLRAQEGLEAHIRPLRGSHLVLPHWRFPVAYSVSYFHPQDKRPVFVFPWEGTTVIGTTDLDHTQDMNSDARITQEEVNYLLDGVQHAFPSWGITQADVRCTWSGIRPVVGTGALDPSKEKREHSIWDDNGLVTVAGGKLTTFRLIALDVLKSAAPYLNRSLSGQVASTIFTHTPAQLASSHDLGPEARQRLLGRYGKAADVVLAGTADAALPIGSSNVCRGEIDWALRHEQVLHLDDLLLRRTRLGLLLPDGAAGELAEIGASCRQLLGWSAAQLQAETERYLEIYRRDFSLPDAAAAVAATASAGTADAATARGSRQ